MRVQNVIISMNIIMFVIGIKNNLRLKRRVGEMMPTKSNLKKIFK